MATRRKIISNFKEGFVQLQETDSFGELRDIIKEMITVCPPIEAHVCKPRIATVMRKKHFIEIRKVKGHPKALQDVDAKYRNLAIVLKRLPVGGMRQRTEPSHTEPSHHERPRHLPQQPSFARNRRLPVKPGGLGAFGLATSLAKSWFQSRKKQLLGMGVAAAGLGGLVWVYNKVYDKDKKDKDKKEDKKKLRTNPDESDGRRKQLESFERAMLSMQRFKAIADMGRDPDASMRDYKDLLSTKPQRKKKATKKEKDKSIDWDEESSLLRKDFDKAHKAISLRKNSEVEIPLLTVSDFSTSAPKVTKTRRRRAKRKNPKPKPEPEVEEVFKPIRPRRVRAKKPKPPVPPTAEIEPEEDIARSRLVPVVKRTKRVKKTR